MKKTQLCLSLLALVLGGCAQPMSNTEKGALIGTGTGAAAGALLGQAIGGHTKGTLIGAGVGAVVGGVAGGAYGRYMDNQEAAMRQAIATSPAATVPAAGAPAASVPATTVQRQQDTLLVNFKSDVLFDTGSAIVKPRGNEELARVAKVLTQYPETTILVAGYTDSTGSEQANEALSQRRAENVKNVLIGQGVATVRMTVIGYGESNPVASNDTPEGRMQNRRVTLTITPVEQKQP